MTQVTAQTGSVNALLEREEPADSRTRRYAHDIVLLHRSLRYGRLVEHARDVGSAYLVEDRRGLTTVGLPNSAVPTRYLKGIAGFRLAQYLALGLASPAVVARDALFSEPTHHANPQDWHFVTLDSGTGEILGYVSLVHTADPEPVSVRDFASRSTFSVEEAHGVDLFAVVDAPAELTTHQVFEIKRFVHSRTLRHVGRRLEVSMELMRAIAQTLPKLSPCVRVLIGAAEPTFALRHLLLLGLSVTVVTDTAPQLDHDHLLYPAYTAREVVEPFYAEVPDTRRQEEISNMLNLALDSPRPTEMVRGLARLAPRKVRQVRYGG